jgi:hypothetical protein
MAATAMDLQPRPAATIRPRARTASTSPMRLRSRALPMAKPGDCLMLADGDYGALVLTAKGTAEAPIHTSAEMISIKGSGVQFRYNTIRKHNGDIDIRAGRTNSISGNYILGPGPGIRMYEDGHRIYNNYVNGGLWWVFPGTRTLV